ncbi:hypothetical protein ACFLYQ_02585 [Chloroflexota bacterium]
MERNKKILHIARILLISVSICILLASFFFHNPKSDPLAIGFDPRMGQTLVYGGFVILIALFAWRWPVPGGIITVFYGAFKLYEYIHIRSISIDAARTLVPAPAYYLLYILFIIGGIICIIYGLRIPATRHHESTGYKELRQIARITTAAPVIFSILYTFGAFIIIALHITMYSPGFLLSSMIFLSPLLLAIIYISWKWPAPGGLLALVIGIPAILLIVSSSMGMEYKIPYAIFGCVFIAGGIMHIVGAFLTRTLMRGNE